MHGVGVLQGGTCVFIDAEHALDMKYAAAVGVDVKELLITQPDSGEQALEVAICLPFVPRPLHPLLATSCSGRAELPHPGWHRLRTRWCAAVGWT